MSDKKLTYIDLKFQDGNSCLVFKSLDEYMDCHAKNRSQQEIFFRNTSRETSKYFPSFQGWYSVQIRF